MTEIEIKNKVNKVIKKYARQHKRKGFHNIEKLSEELERFKRELTSELDMSNYLEYCKEKDRIEEIIDNQYNFYFKVQNFYNHLHGNDNFKKLIVY